WVLLSLHRSVGPPTPFCPRAVVDRNPIPSEEVEPERQHRGGDARAAGRDHGAVEIDARGLEGASQLAGPEERAVPRVEPLVRQVEAVRDVTGAQPRARLGLGADKTAVRARVEHLLAAAREVCAHLLEIAHEAPAKTGRVAAPPGTCASTNSSKASRPSPRMCHEPSTTRRLRRPRFATSHPVVTSAGSFTGAGSGYVPRRRDPSPT